MLSNPFKEQVVIHRADSDAKRKSAHEKWLHTAANGGVLVSPFISPAEKTIRAEAEEHGAKIILIISLGLPPKTPLTRELCLAMNTLADTIANCTH